MKTILFLLLISINATCNSRFETLYFDFPDLSINGRGIIINKVTISVPRGYNGIWTITDEEGGVCYELHYKDKSILYIGNMPSSLNSRHLDSFLTGPKGRFDIVGNELFETPEIITAYDIPSNSDFTGRDWLKGFWRDAQTRSWAVGYFAVKKKSKAIFDMAIESLIVESCPTSDPHAK